MGLFDIFKSKEQKTLDKAMDDILAVIFPKGDCDIVRDAKRVHSLTHGKLSMEECIQCVKGSKTVILISEDKSAERAVPSIMARTHHKISEKEAYRIYAYLSGESMYLDRLYTVMGMSDDESAKALFQDGIDANELPNGYGEYGREATNPILTISSYGNEDYLNRLRFNGQAITYQRLGSTASDVSSSAIDVYTISFSDRPLGEIYICPYHQRNSTKPPKGFSFINK